MFLFKTISFLLLQCLCLSKVTQIRETKCFGDLGCFSSNDIIPAPQSPEQIATVFRLSRRGNPHTFNLESLHLQSQQGGWSSHFDSTKKTKVIIHGYTNSAASAWIPRLTTELLKKGDYNVIVVDWGHGAKTDYLHATANTFVVGAETTTLLKYLHNSHKLNYTDVHIIGHSLGAQIAGHVGQAIPNIARITGMDPADPGFTGQPTDRRLDATDAIFVDVIHTDASKFNLVSGFGTRDAVGDIDFYPNGGEHQPGCEEKPLSGAIDSISAGQLAGATLAITCSHGRSHELFIESINSQCKFYAHTCPSGDSFEAGNCLGCPANGCAVMGFDADQRSDLRGSFYLSTSGEAPFCGHEYFVDVKVTDSMFNTYGEFLITLVGTHGKTEPLKFESLMHTINHGSEEKHVIATHNNIGTVTSVQLQFVKSHDLHGVFSLPFVKVHSVMVEPAETAQRIMFCAHDQRILTNQTITVSSHAGC